MADSPFSLQDRDIWIVGGAGYLGRAAVAKAVACGAKVLCVDLPGKSQALAGDRVTAADLDMNRTEDIPHFISQQFAKRGVPAGLVVMTYAAAGVKFDALTPEGFDRSNHGNLTATFMLARQVGEAMSDRGGGSVVLFSSMYGGVAPDPKIYEPPMEVNPVEYGVAKAGVRQLARYLAVRWGPKRVRCNSISPGPFPNPTICANEPAFVERLSKKVPLGRVGRAEEIGGAVAFLLADESSFVTGIDLPVDGGWTTW